MGHFPSLWISFTGIRPIQRCTNIRSENKFSSAYSTNSHRAGSVQQQTSRELTRFTVLVAFRSHTTILSESVCSGLWTETMGSQLTVPNHEEIISGTNSHHPTFLSITIQHESRSVFSLTQDVWKKRSCLMQLFCLLHLISETPASTRAN